MAVIILGDLEDEHALHVQEHLMRQGVAAQLLDSRWFPRDLMVWYDPRSGQGGFEFPSGETLALDAIEAVYWRAYHGVHGPQLPDPEQTFIAENDARSLFESILLTLPARWVNSFAAYRSHQTKGAQLAAVAALGVAVPETVLTNHPAEVTRFYDPQRPAIYKPVQGGAHTRRLTEGTLRPERLRHLQLAPITIQREIPGTNIRVFVAGERIEACEIRTAEVDFRDDPDADLRRHRLPDEVQEQCRAIAKTLGLCWTGIDFRRTPNGEYFFLEANPSPMFLGFEAAIGIPLTEMLCGLLRPL